jgi:hypothetical protein
MPWLKAEISKLSGKTPSFKELRRRFTTLPTVYYLGGRATLEHDLRGNIDWHGNTRRWFFFQNVPYDRGSTRRHTRTDEIKAQLERGEALSFFQKPTQYDEMWLLQASRITGQVLNRGAGHASDRKLGKAAAGQLAKLFYAKEIFEQYGTYCWLELWSPEPMGRPDGEPPATPPVQLLEAYDEGNAIAFHPSRNPFHRVLGPDLKEALHSLALSPAMADSRKLATH